jgi:hypothetical protein
LSNEFEADSSGKDIAPQLATLNALLGDEAPWLFIVHDLQGSPTLDIGRRQYGIDTLLIVGMATNVARARSATA